MVVSLAVFAGCSRITPPTLDIAGPAAHDASPDGRVLMFTLSATNDNDEELPLMEVRYRAKSGGQTIFRGRRSAQASAPREGISTINLPVPVPAGTDLDGAVNITGTLIYRRSGRLSKALADLGIHPSAGFRHEAATP